MVDTHASLVADLQARWPEHRIAPSLGRVQALLGLLGEPQASAPVIQVAGTNGKGSTAIMIDALLRSAGLRTGRFSSPHLTDLTERICIDGRPISAERFDEVWEEVSPFVELVDAQLLDGVRMTFFEVITCLAFAAFADAPVDVMVIETGLGGTWDATNAADADVAVICPIDFDHTHILGSTLTGIAGEKAGIIKPGATAVLAGQQPEAARVLMNRCAEVGAEAKREGIDFGLLGRSLAVGGQVLRLDTADGPLGDVFLPLYGEHMARNAALAVAACEAFLGGKPLGADVVTDGLAAVEAPARLELVRRSPAVVLDTAHNPHGVRATMAAVTEAYAFEPLIAIVAMMRDKDVAQVLRELHEQVSQVIVTRVTSTDRGLEVDELAELAEGVWEPGMVHRADDIEGALEVAVALADSAGPQAGVLVVGSVILAGEARALLVTDEHHDEPVVDDGFDDEEDLT